jgi:hypothetical protein
MIVCPVCEHSQPQGPECEMCGKRFGAAVGRDLPVERVAGLELTAVEDVQVAQVAQLPDLEVTRLPSGPDLPLWPVPELDPVRAQVGEVPVQRLTELEGHRLEPNPAERTALPGGPTPCRYCRHVQATGNVCDRCGMRLNRVRPTSSAAPASGGRPEDAPAVMHACGARTRPGAPCSSCGAFVPLSA